MKRFDPQKLNVEFRNVTPTEPVMPRRYTLTHSDITAELFLTVGLRFAYDKINLMRDEMLAEWRYDSKYFLWAYVYVGGFSRERTARRYNIFKKELPLALWAMRNGDHAFFARHPPLDKAPIYVFFDSTWPDYKGIHYYETPSHYIGPPGVQNRPQQKCHESSCLPTQAK